MWSNTAPRACARSGTTGPLAAAIISSNLRLTPSSWSGEKYTTGCLYACERGARVREIRCHLQGWVLRGVDHPRVEVRSPQMRGLLPIEGPRDEAEALVDGLEAVQAVVQCDQQGRIPQWDVEEAVRLQTWVVREQVSALPRA
jgi:hypothetical protein